MNRRFVPLMLAGMAFGLIVLGGVPGLIPNDRSSRVVDVVTTAPADPAAFTSDEQLQNLDCVSNADWPEGEFPTSALVRRGDADPLERVTFDEAWAMAEAGEAWFIASCGPA